MPRKRSRAHKKAGGSKSQDNRKIFYYVCYTFQATELFSTKYYPSSVLHQICDVCIHQYILSTLNSCLLNSVTCPELNCRAIISSSHIRDILLKYNDHDLLENYLREQRWKGKSEEWIQYYTLRCPGCDIPIQKSGGCNRMVCSRCKKCFYWTKSLTSGEYDIFTIAEFCGAIVMMGIIMGTIFLFYSCYLRLNKK